MVVSDIFYFHPYLGKIPIWLIFFQGVETTNQLILEFCGNFFHTKTFARKTFGASWESLRKWVNELQTIVGSRLSGETFLGRRQQKSRDISHRFQWNLNWDIMRIFCVFFFWMLHDAFPVANSVHSGLSAYMRMIFKDQFIHGVGWLSYGCFLK